jgi:hypothetical protein
MENKMPKFIEVRKDVFATGSVANDQKDLREFYRANIDDIILAFDECNKIFKVDKVKLFVRNIRSKSTVGFYKNSNKEISIDLRSYDIKGIVSTIIHEMTHAQQHDTKKMFYTNKQVNFYGKLYNIVSAEKDHEAYLNLPWEIEARKMQQKYLEKVMKVIFK